MKLRLILLLSVLSFTACSKTPVAELVESEESGAAKTTATSDAQPTSDSKLAETATAKTPVAKTEVGADSESSSETASAEPSPEAIAAAAALAERVEAAQTEFDDIEDQYKKEFRTWQTNVRRAKTREAQMEMIQNRPGEEFAKKYLALADKFPDTPAVSTSLANAMRFGTGETKKAASRRMFEAAQADTGTDQWERLSPMISISQLGDDETKLKASQILADVVVNDPNLESEVAKKVVPIVLKLRGDHPAKEQVAQIVIDNADQDVGSKKSFDSLYEVASFTTGATKSAALSKISEQHPQSDRLTKIINKFSSGRTPDEAAEHWLKEICRQSTDGSVKSKAAIALKNVIDKRDSYRSIFVGADEETRSSLDAEMLAYLDKTPEPNELEMIETTLSDYVSDTEALLKTVKSKLFVVKNLSVGKVAPDIVGTDVDGVEFKLSDYRGKVVFLDFWGDW